MKRNIKVRDGFNPYLTGEAETPEFREKLKDGRVFFLKSDDGSMLAYEHSLTREERGQELIYRKAYWEYAVEERVAGREPLEYGVWEMPSSPIKRP